MVNDVMCQNNLLHVGARVLNPVPVRAQSGGWFWLCCAQAGSAHRLRLLLLVSGLHGPGALMFPAMKSLGDSEAAGLFLSKVTLGALTDSGLWKYQEEKVDVAQS